MRVRFELGGPITFSGNGLFITPRNGLPTDIFAAGGSSSGIPGGTIRIMNTSVLPTTARLGVSNGLFDFGANNITIGALNFVNQSDGLILFNPATGAAGAGVIGTGTLRVTGAINTIGVFGNNFGSNSVATNLDLGGGTQIVRTASNGAFMSQGRALQFTRSLSNGSLLRTFGLTENGVMGNPDGMALHGNNTYTGSTTLNGGNNFMSGTNATSLVTIVGDRGLGAPTGSFLNLHGANGSLGSAPLIQAFAGAQFIIDNNLAFAGGRRHSHHPGGTEQQPHPRRCGDPASRGWVHLPRPGRRRSERDLRQPECHRWPQQRHPHPERRWDCNPDRERKPHPRATVHAPGHLGHTRRCEQVLCQRYTPGRRRDRHPVASRRFD